MFLIFNGKGMVTEFRRLQALEEFTHALAKPLSPSELVALAVDKALVGTGMEVAELFLVGESVGESLLVCHRGLFPEAFRQITRFPPGVGYPGLVASRGETIATDNLPADGRYLRTRVKELGFRTYFCLPLLLEERVLGCLNIATRHKGEITSSQRQFVEGIGGGLSLALGAGRWRLAQALAHQGEIEGIETSQERAATTVLEAIAIACSSSGAALFLIPLPGSVPRLLATWGTWEQAGLPSGELPPRCPALSAPRFSPCPALSCPFTARTSVCYPLRGKGEMVGILCLGYQEGMDAPVEAFSLLSGVTDILALGLRQFQQYHLAQEQAAEGERQRLAQEIHNGVVQSLGLLRVKAEYLSRLAQGEPGKLSQELRELHLLMGEVTEELRRTIHSLLPAELEREGLVASLHNLAQRLERVYQVPVKVLVHGAESVVAPWVQLPLLRLAQEALSNALRHSGGSYVELELELHPSTCQLLVRDNGRGFDPKGTPRGLGLLAMEERTRSLGGRLIIDSSPRQGTVVQAWLPGGR